MGSTRKIGSHVVVDATASSSQRPASHGSGRADETVDVVRKTSQRVGGQPKVPFQTDKAVAARPGQDEGREAIAPREPTSRLQKALIRDVVSSNAVFDAPGCIARQTTSA